MIDEKHDHRREVFYTKNPLIQDKCDTYHPYHWCYDYCFAHFPALLVDLNQIIDRRFFFVILSSVSTMKTICQFQWKKTQRFEDSHSNS